MIKKTIIGLLITLNLANAEMSKLQQKLCVNYFDSHNSEMIKSLKYLEIKEYETAVKHLKLQREQLINLIGECKIYEEQIKQYSKKSYDEMFNGINTLIKRYK